VLWILLALAAPLAGVQATTILPEAPDGSTVWTGNNPLALDAAQIGGIVGQAGLGLFYEAGFGKARIASDGDVNGQVVVTALQQGTAGHDITVQIIKPGVANSPLSVTVIGRSIVVGLSTDAGGATTSTAQQVAAAINASPASAALVSASASGTGLGVVQALSTTSLAPVIVESGPFAGAYQTTFASTPSFPQDATVAFGSGAAIAASSLFLYVRDTGNAPAFYIYDLLAPSVLWNGLDDLALRNFWLENGSIEQLSIVGIAAGTTPVPEGSSLALLALGLGVLALARVRARPRAYAAIG
jgi:hypothetical protein